jgi:hypothetical protein
MTRSISLGIFFLLLASGGITCAADSSNRSGRIPRLQYVAGEVSVQPYGTGEWVQGSVIHPLTNADNVWADKNSRAELNLGSGRMRIDSETSLTLTNVNDMSVQVELHQGVLNVHIRRLGNNETYEIGTPNLGFTVTKPGDYRIDVPPNEDSTIVTVRHGEGQATGHGTVVTIHAGEQTKFGTGSLKPEVHETPRQDGFDMWCQVRDQRLNQAVSARYVSRYVVGDSDVDEYREWRETLVYGPAWVPTAVAPGWAPYGNAYRILNPWGLTPFPYGRWVYYGYHATPW